MWQDLAVYIIVAAAAVYLGRHWLLTTRGDKGCGGCGGGGCASKTKLAQPREEKLVQIDLNMTFKP